MPSTKKPKVASATIADRFENFNEWMVKNGWLPTEEAPVKAEANTASFRKFLNLMFDGCTGPVNVCVLKNSSGAGPQLTSSDSEALTKFITRNDLKGQGVYCCVSTMVNTKHHHAKDSISETPALHIDIDLKDISDSKDDVIRILRALHLPPSFIVDSGNGCHAYWKFKEAFTYSKNKGDREKNIKRIEDVLLLLCDLVGGDVKPMQPSAVMRLPGSHNSKKQDQYHEVAIVWKNDGDGKAELVTYELDDLEEWLSEASPKILRKDKPISKTVGEIDPVADSVAARYERIFKELDYKPPINVPERLNAMMFMGELDSSIHLTQLSVSAALLQAGEKKKDVVALLLKHTRTAAGDYGKSWNWTNGKHSEESRLFGMCDSWEKKHPKTKPNSKSSDHRERPQSTPGPASPGETKTEVKDKARPFYQTVAEAFFLELADLNQDLRIFRDSKGNESLWHYEDCLWTLVQNEKKWLEGEVERTIRNLKDPHKSSIKMRAEAVAFILCHPNVRKLQVFEFDQHGKIPVMGTLIDPYTLKAEPILKEHYCTWYLSIVYDKDAKCPWWLQMLADTFSDRSEEERKERIELLQDFFGASLIDNKKKALRKAMTVIGESNSGKSAILDVFSGMFGGDPITTPIADLTGNHGTQSFLKRRPWILHEAFDQSAWHISSKAKQILGGDPFEINPKGKAAISMEFTAPSMFATNHPPKFKESTKAMINRMLLMYLTNVFDEDKEIGAAAEARKRKYPEPQEFVLNEEKSGILNWMLIGAQRAMDHGKYKDTAEGKEALHEVRLDSNLAAGYVEECIDFDPNVRMPVPDFNASFFSWWKEHRGDERQISPDQIGRALKALSHAKIAIDRKRFKNDKGIRYYCGIKFTEAGKDHWANTAVALSMPGYGSKGDLSRMSTDISNTCTPILASWDDHPAIIKIRDNAAKERAKKPKSKFPKQEDQ